MANRDEQFIYVTTTGWKSGNPHEIEIWFVERDGRYYIVAERREKTHWVQNIQRNPAVTGRLAGQPFSGMGRVVHDADEPELAAAVKALMDAKYRWSDGLIVELRPNV